MIFEYEGLKYKLILLTLSGSRFYNTHYEKGEHPFIKDYESDYDYKGVYIASIEDKISLSKNYKKEIQPDKLDKETRRKILNQINNKLNMNIKLDEDFVLYEIETFIKMAQNDNPNILDILFSDKESIYYIDKYGKEIFKNKKTFLSKRLEESFSKYGLSQMTKMKNHYKMIGKYPEVTEVTEAVKKAYENKKINFQWISDNFSGDLATYITGMSQEEYNKIKNKKYNYDWENFKKEFCQNIKNIQKYHRALIIDYINVKYVNGKNIPLDTKQELILSVGIIKNNKGIEIKEPTVKDFLMYKCTFRTIGESVYNIFTPPENYEKFKGGIVSKTGLEIKKQDPKEIGYFLFTIVVKKNEFKAHQDEIKKLWEWKTNRNEKRSVLEKHFGYDTKNAAHLIRLLISAKKIFINNIYNPRLQGEELKEIKKVLNGEYSYEFIMKKAEKLSKENKTLVKKSKLPDIIDKNEATKILLHILKKYYKIKQKGKIMKENETKTEEEIYDNYDTDGRKEKSLKESKKEIPPYEMEEYEDYKYDKE